MFGVGCDPDSESAVMALLELKQRAIEKGLILIADNYEQLKPYIDDNALTQEQRERMFASWLQAQSLKLFQLSQQRQNG